MNTQSISGKTREFGRPTASNSFLRMLHRPRLLVADDDPTTSSCLVELAIEQGYKIVAVRDGGEAYRLLQNDADFSVAIINMTIPGIRGLDILRHMKTENRLKRIPVIIVTGENGLQVISESFAAGAIALVPKPLKAEQLWLMVRTVSEVAQQKRRAA
jgi:CheY-like chemotaxis protein